jgi:uncharacterized protein YkwD
MMRLGIRLATAIAIGMMACAAAFAETDVVRVERELLVSVNQARHSQGLSPLRWSSSLATAARHHAAVMAEHGTAQHSFLDEPELSDRAKQAGAHFSSLSENVTQGPTAEFVHSQFMNSPPHRSNILDSDMDSIGIGVVEKRGQLFVVENFSRTR